MKINQICIILGSLALLSSLLMLLSVPTSPMVPLIGSIGLIVILYGIFSIQKYDTLIFTVISSILVLVGGFLSYYNASLPVNKENAMASYISMSIIVFLMVFLVFGCMRVLKSQEKARKYKN
jgi:hypothetical protein